MQSIKSILILIFLKILIVLNIIISIGFLYFNFFSNIKNSYFHILDSILFFSVKPNIKHIESHVLTYEYNLEEIQENTTNSKQPRPQTRLQLVSR